ncbi:hypothetical protein TrRE_jg5189 [Triparma retinervis]|uniref:Uncharacterized protein n=1 Tax=Triparma retinervis TaxID=2557542 RepID=A0A9W7AS06_9STRA|nr:hypothetical protein TrRE_jg5189 [Triparma retinervis]
MDASKPRRRQKPRARGSSIERNSIERNDGGSSVEGASSSGIKGRRVGRGRSIERNDRNDNSDDNGSIGAHAGRRRRRRNESTGRDNTDTSGDDNSSSLAVFPSNRRSRSIERASDHSRDPSPFGQRGRGRGREAGGRSGAGSSYSRSPSVERIKLGESEYKTMLAEQQAKRRAEINEKRKNRRESSLEARERRVGARGEVGSVKWMQEQLFEVELVLRQGINCEDDLHYTLGAAEAGLLFMDQIEKRAKEAGVTKGALSRFVLPFDSETYVTDQAAPFKKSGLSTEGSLFEGKISDRDLNYLVKGANSMRRLVRIKVADDNDLETAAAALKLTSTFLNKCVADAKRRGLHDNIYNTLYKSLREGKGEAKINELYPLGE